MAGDQGQIPGGVRSGQLLNEAAGEAGRDLAQFDSLVLAPGEEAAHGTGIGAAGMGVGDAGGEELIGGEEGIFARPLQDSGEGPGQRFGAGSELVHI